MLRAQTALLQNDSAAMIRVLEDREAVTARGALLRLRDDAAFRAFFAEVLRDGPFPAFRMEWPPLTLATADAPLEFVLVKDIGLERRANSAAFAEHLSGGELAVGFANLGRDAFLIVPGDPGGAADYAHLGAFLRNAPEAAVDALWRRVGEAALPRLTANPIWLSSAGGGVPWLHVRLDTRPKYYTFALYRRAP